MPRKLRVPKGLTTGLAHRLHGYSMAAQAAGIGLVVCALPAAGSVVYTSAHVVISPDSVYDLDVNGDGTADFRFRDLANLLGGYLSVNGRQASNSVLVAPRREAEALSAGDKIGSSGYFFNCRTCQAFGAAMLNVTDNFTYGNWDDVRNRYLGLKFLINGQIHYGWARLSVRFHPGTEVEALLTGYAYETTANQAILAGQTTSDGDEQNLNESGPNAAVLQKKQLTLGSLALGTRVNLHNHLRSRDPGVSTLKYDNQ